MRRKGDDVPEDANRRGAARFDTEGAVTSQLELDLDSDILYLSKGGMMIRMPFAPEIGSVHDLALGFGDETMQVKAVVRNNQALAGDGKSVMYGVGVEFVDLKDRERELLDRFIAQRLKS